MMSRLRVESFAISVDGYGAGPNQGVDKGWWGDNPPFHVPVFLLSHHLRASITMAGGTTFHFVAERTLVCRFRRCGARLSLC
jgi:hypothetical protein